MKSKQSRLIWIVALAGMCALAAEGANVWLPASGTNDWFVGGNWSLAHCPAAGEEALITNAGSVVRLSNSTAILGSLTVSNAVTLVFSNWDTALNAVTVTIATNATFTCAGPFTNNAMSNRVNIVCSNLTVDVGGKINVDYVGYASGQGPGAGAWCAAYYNKEGGSYGGYGQKGDVRYCTARKAPYGLANEPAAPGSGGGPNAYVLGGAGGGNIRVSATGRIVVRGTLSACGGATSASGVSGCGGSGGGIFLTCQTFGGNGIIKAEGGTAVSYYRGLCGGGGRIAVVYDPAAQSNEPTPTVQFSALPGLDTYTSLRKGDPGSLHFPDTAFWSASMTNLQGRLFGPKSWVTANLVVSNRFIGFSEEGFHLTVSGNVIVAGANGWLGLGGPEAKNYGYSFDGDYRFGGTSAPVVTVGGNLVLTNSAAMSVYSGIDPSGTNYGAWVNVGGTVEVASNSWIYVSSHPTNGASPLFTVGNLTLNTGAGISADYRGYAGQAGTTVWGYGPGGAYGQGGGGYGGSGGPTGVWYAGVTNGSSNAPIAPGSAGGTYSSGQGGQGGGSVRIDASQGRVCINGTITALGVSPYASWYYGGGGSGGGIYILCKDFAGSTNGLLRANGGTGGASCGGGGGGRIAVWRLHGSVSEQVQTSASGGAATAGNGETGTIVFGWVRFSGDAVISVW